MWRSLSGFSAEFLLDTNPLADWMDSCLVLEPNAKTYVGTLSKSAELYLYPSYCRWMDETGSRSVSLRRFSECLIDLCSNQLKLQGIKKGRDNQGAYITGLAIRQPGSDATRPITGGDSLVTSLYGTSDDLSDELVTTQSLASDGSDGLISEEQPSTITENLLRENQNPSHSQPITTHHHPTPNVTIAVNSTADYSGEKVTIVGWKDNGKQVWVELSSGKQVLVKRGNLKPWKERT